MCPWASEIKSVPAEDVSQPHFGFLLGGNAKQLISSLRGFLYLKYGAETIPLIDSIFFWHQH